MRASLCVFGGMLISLCMATRSSLANLSPRHDYAIRQDQSELVAPLRGCSATDGAEPCTDLTLASWGECTNFPEDTVVSSVFMTEVDGAFCMLFDDYHCGGNETDPSPGVNNLPEDWVNNVKSYNCFLF
ncbi:hypothetical protein GLAREA_12262 [Glarea lozoyensis ATCC 20868]|uniref:Uncharacterized protein n=1 Tax=Glarea lozoyensis (strain ATCC 20868 / MF5171) TaxID=1116229 RepID=S3DHJ1_GLAL2|nr:uncharacterized protein GLAREA_12262 [Glarea lozoyensis ATCC 20868]EPE31506.1 hypothetical protein GLAREA_12262 [Glarea lozoyensis ATCC 20868]